MPWSYTNWLICNIMISLGITLITTIVLLIMLWRWNTIFYGLLSKLFNIERQVVDVNHQIIQTNPDISRSRRRFRNFVYSIWNFRAAKRRVQGVTSEKRDNNHSTTSEPIRNSNKRQPPDTLLDMSDPEQSNSEQAVQSQSYRANRITSGRRYARGTSVKQLARSLNTTNRKSSPKQTVLISVTEDDPVHPKYRRVILNVYGKYLPLRKKRNQCLVVIISSVVISAVIIAFIDGCVLASQSVYPSSQCPAYGDMDCFHGSNQTYFLCQIGESIDFPLLGTSATCYRWIGRDQLVTSILAQVGICSGLLSALGALIQVLIKVLFYVYQQRRGVAAGIRRVLERTVGINNVTQPVCSCCIRCPCRFAPMNLSLYRHQVSLCLTVIGYVALALVSVLGFIPLTWFQVSITSYTYIVLSGIAMLCLSSVVWVMWEVDEICRVLPGGYISIKEIISDPAFKTVVGLVKDSIQNNEKNKPTETGSDDESASSNSSGFISTMLDKKEEIVNSATKIYSRLTSDRTKKLSQDVIGKLKELTNFSEKEEWHAGFMHDCSNGILSRDQFISIFETYYTKGSRADSFWNYFFKMVKQKEGEDVLGQKEEINFVEFLVVIAPNTHGDSDSRLTLAFEMYDISEPLGRIDKKEVIKWIKAMYDITGISTRDLMNDYGGPEKNAADIMAKFDKDKDGTLSLQEFKDGCKTHDKLARILLASFDKNLNKQL